MSGLKNTFKRIWNFGTPGGIKGYQTKDEKHAKDRAELKAERDAIYSDVAIPDAEEIKRNERRKAAKRQGSRANTVLTNK